MRSPREAGSVPPQSEWKPKTEVEDDWQPQTERTPVKAHSRAKRGRLGATIGGFAGGLAGKPFGGPLGSIPAAGALGSAGEAIEQVVRGEPLEPSQIAQAGGEQAAYEAAGGMLAKGVKLGGRFAMQAALRATPEVAQVAVREGITATKAGVNKLLLKLGQSGKATETLVSQAGRSGARYQPADIATSVYQELAPTIQKQAIYGEDLKALGSLSRRFLRDNRGLMTPQKLHAIKQSSDQAAKAIYQRIERGGAASGTDLLEARWHKATADKARALLDAIPGYTQSNARTQELIAVKQAVFPEVKKGAGLVRRLAARAAPGATVGAFYGSNPQERFVHGLEGAALSVGLTSPQAMSMIALMLSNPALAALLGQTPRAAGLAVQE